MSLTRPSVWGLFCVRATEFQFSDFSVNHDSFELIVLLLLKTVSDSWHQESQKVKEETSDNVFEGLYKLSLDVHRYCKNI